METTDRENAVAGSTPDRTSLRIYTDRGAIEPEKSIPAPDYLQGDVYDLG